MDNVKPIAPKVQTNAEGAGRRSDGDYVKQAAQAWKWLRETSRIYSRRFICGVQNLVAGHRASGPISFLAVSACVGVAFTLSALYTPSYSVFVDGQELGVVYDHAVVDEAVAVIEAQGRLLFGYDYQVENSITYEMGLSLKSELADEASIERFFFTQMGEVADVLRKYQIKVGGNIIGVMEKQEDLHHLLEEIKSQYVTEHTVWSDFVEPLAVTEIYHTDQVLTADQLRETLTANTTGETTYTVVRGDTFNAIAYANNMSSSDLQALNPGININRLSIGDVLNVKEIIPFLSVATREEVTYTEPVACPVETVDDPNMYKGNSKILVQGVEGEALIEATVSYVNGRETGREVLSSTTLREPTVTTKAVGTKERPKTASTGSFQWPYRGRISSYFGGRYIFGSYSYHAGLDISGSYGAAIVAADGGTVTFSGYKGSYGNLIVITHDNGVQSYYAHCSSLLVSSGTKVYKGQTIARVGSTGRSTGNHLHFEVRVNGTAVNPLSYLP